MEKHEVLTEEERQETQNSDIVPRLLFLLCMECPLSPSLAKIRLQETGLHSCDNQDAYYNMSNVINVALENLRRKGILYRNPDGSYQINRNVEHFFRLAISDALSAKSSGNRVEQLIRKGAQNFIARARSVRESFQKKVQKELAAEYHDLSSKKARDIVISLWEEIEHKRIYNSLHCIFDMLPIGIIDFGISKEEIALEERFFAMSYDQMANFMIEQIKIDFEKHRKNCEYRFRENRREAMPKILEDFRAFLEKES